MQTLQDEILDFWFGPRGSPRYGESRSEWFRKDSAFDAGIRTRFGAAIHLVAALTLLSGLVVAYAMAEANPQPVAVSP